MTLEEQLKAVAEANDELESQNERLKAALKPFAAVVVLPGAPGDGWLIGWMDERPDMPTVGDCRRAAELLAELEGGQ